MKRPTAHLVGMGASLLVPIALMTMACGLLLGCGGEQAADTEQASSAASEEAQASEQATIETATEEA